MWMEAQNQSHSGGTGLDSLDCTMGGIRDLELVLQG